MFLNSPASEVRTDLSFNIPEEEEKEYENRQKEEEEAKELYLYKLRQKAKEIAGVPSLGTAIGGTAAWGLGHGLVKAINNDILNDVINYGLVPGNYNPENAQKVLDLIRDKEKVKLVDDAELALYHIGSHHPVIEEAYKKLPLEEKINILINGGFLSPFASEGEYIYAGPAGISSAGVLAHELGHIMNARDRKSNFSKDLANISYSIGATVPQIAAAGLATAGLLGVSDNALLAGGLLGSGLSIPTLIEEFRASKRGADYLKEHNINADENSTPYSGLPTYAASALLPMLPYLGRKVYKGLKALSEEEEEETPDDYSIEDDIYMEEKDEEKAYNYTEKSYENTGSTEKNRKQKENKDYYKEAEI